MSVKDVPDEAEFSILRDALAIMGGNLLVSVLRDMIEGKVRLFSCSPDRIVSEC